MRNHWHCNVKNLPKLANRTLLYQPPSQAEPLSSHPPSNTDGSCCQSRRTLWLIKAQMASNVKEIFRKLFRDCSLTLYFLLYYWYSFPDHACERCFERIGPLVPVPGFDSTDIEPNEHGAQIFKGAIIKFYYIFLWNKMFAGALGNYCKAAVAIFLYLD